MHCLGLLITTWTTEKDIDAIKHLGFLFPGCSKSPGSVNRKPIEHIDLRHRSRTIKDIRHIKQSFDFWDIWLRSGPSSNLPAVWLPYQTTLFNYSEVLKPLYLCLNCDKIKIVPRVADVRLTVPHWQQNTIDNSLVPIRGIDHRCTHCETVWNNAQLPVWYPCVGCVKNRSDMKTEGIKGSEFKQSGTQMHGKRCKQNCNQ